MVKRFLLTVSALGVVACEGGALFSSASESPPAPVAAVADGDPDPEAPDVVATPRPALRVLFVGNSYTAFHDMPGLLSRIAQSANEGPTISTEMAVLGGATLHRHWEDFAGARTRIAEGGWTHVVLQGQSQEPTGSGREGFLTHAKLLGDAVTEVGARPTWFVTFAYGNASRTMQDDLSSAYAEAARSVPGSLLACVGEAFRATAKAHPEIVLRESDQSHPSLDGSYLAASTFYVALTGAPVPAQSEVPSGVDPAVAATLRAAANVGSKCADARSYGDVRVTGDGFHQLPDGTTAGPGDFDTTVTPRTRHLYLWNGGSVGTQLLGTADLAPPFSWASGAYPGGAGVDPIYGRPYCTSVLAPDTSCALAVRYDATSTSTSSLRIQLGDAYDVEAIVPLIGRTTDRAHLTLRRSSANIVAVAVDGTFHGLITNTGSRPASAIAITTEPTGVFSWGGSGVFPGGAGAVGVDGTMLPHCTTELAPAERCVLTFALAAPQPFEFFTMPLVLTYASSPSAVAPLVTDSTTASITVRSRSVP